MRVNGKLAVLGDRADPERDSVKVDERRVRVEAGPKTYLLLNKPKGFVTTVSDPEGRDTVLMLLPGRLRKTVKPVGRLDVQTEGLLLLTDDGDLARLVTHPSTGCSKEYLAKVSGEPAPAKLEKLLAQQRELEKRITELQTKLAGGAARDVASDVREVGGVRVLATRIDDIDGKALRETADRLRDQKKLGVVLVGSASSGNAFLVASVAKDLTKQFNAGNIIKELAPLVGGGGGGRPDFAQAGGKDPSRLDEALSKFYTLVGAGSAS